MPIQLIQKLVYQLSTNKWTSTIGNWENPKTGNRIRKGKFQEKLIVAHPENLEYLFFFLLMKNLDSLLMDKFVLKNFNKTAK